MKCPGLVADDLSGFWRVPNRGMGMQPEVRRARYVEALERYRGGRLSSVEAAELLEISERHFRRLHDRCEASGRGGCDRPTVRSGVGAAVDRRGNRLRVRTELCRLVPGELDPG